MNEFYGEKDVKKIVDLCNKFINDYIKILNPKKYEKDLPLFVNIALSGPAMITDTMLDKVSGTLKINKKDLTEQFCRRLEHAEVIRASEIK